MLPSYFVYQTEHFVPEQDADVNVYLTDLLSAHKAVDVDLPKIIDPEQLPHNIERTHDSMSSSWVGILKRV